MAPREGVAIARVPRFKAIVTMDATPGLLTPDDLAHVRVPVLSILAALSPSDDFSWYSAKADPFLEVALTNAAHDEFTDVCAWQNLIPNSPQAPKIVVAFINSLANMSCHPPHMTPDRVHTLTDWYAVAFLERYLAGDNRYARYLSQYPPGPHTDVQVAHPTPVTMPPPA